MRIKHLFIYSFAILLLTACKKEDGIDTFQSVDADGWEQRDTLIYTVPASSAKSDFDLEVGVRINRHFAFRNLWLVVEQHYERHLNAAKDSLIRQSFCDTVCLQLTNTHQDFNGQGNNLLQYTVPVRFVRIHQGESGEIRIRHIMDDKTIKGVNDVGIILSDTKHNLR